MAFSHLRLCTLLRSLCGDQAPLGLVPEVLPLEAAAERQRPASSRRSQHSDARRRGRLVFDVQAHRFKQRLEG
jgi:hypothetical protein